MFEFIAILARMPGEDQTAARRPMRPFERAEHFLFERAPEDLPELYVADVVSDVLGMVLQHVQLPTRTDDDPGDNWFQT
jgi:hypothetical protein